MAETKMPIYIGKKALEDIIVFDDTYPNLHHIFKNHAVICVNLSDEELDEILDDEESQLSQFSRNDVKIVALKGYFSDLQEDVSRIVEKPRAMFFFDIPKSEAAKISLDYGIVVQSEKAMDDNVLQLSFKKRAKKGDVFTGTPNGWLNMLKSQKLPPSNSLIITDNYLLQNETRGKSIGFENLKMILSVIMPQKLTTPYHLLILSTMPPKMNPEKANWLNEQLKAYLKTIRDYDIQLEFVFNDTIHPRKLISNYFVLTCDKGFQLFHPMDTNTIYDDNQIMLTSVLHDPHYSSGDSELCISEVDIADIKKGCATLREQILSGINNPYKKIIGDAGADKTIKNRLFH